MPTMTLSLDGAVPGVLRIEHVGSRVTCNPAPKWTDDDYLVLVKDVKAAGWFLEAEGWKLGGSDPGNEGVVPADQRFSSFTLHKGSVTNDCINLILTASSDFFDRFMLATHVAKTLNIQPKIHRIVLFQAILYGRYP